MLLFCCPLYLNVAMFNDHTQMCVVYFFIPNHESYFYRGPKVLKNVICFLPAHTK